MKQCLKPPHRMDIIFHIWGLLDGKTGKMIEIILSDQSCTAKETTLPVILGLRVFCY